MFWAIFSPILGSTRLCLQLVVDEVELSSTSSSLPAGSIVVALYHKLQTQCSAPEDGRNYRPKHVELIGIINKPLLLHLVGYIIVLSEFNGKLCKLGRII